MQRSFPPYGTGLAGTLTPRDGTRAYTDYNPYKYSAVGVRRTVNGSVVDYTPCFTEATLGYTFVWDPKLVRRANFKLNYIWRSKNFLAPNAGQSGEQGGDSLVAAFQVYF